MKRIILAAAVVLGLTSFGFLSSCQKDYNNTEADDTISTPNAMRGHFTCAINGMPFEGEFQTAQIVNTSGITSLTVTGWLFGKTRLPSDVKVVAFTIVNYEGPKTYEIQPYTALTGYNVSVPDSAQRLYSVLVPDPDNQITITEDATDVKGNFNFKVQEINNTDPTKIQEITVGEFDIPRT